jgi:hypothetical protein
LFRGKVLDELLAVQLHLNLPAPALENGALALTILRPTASPMDWVGTGFRVGMLRAERGESDAAAQAFRDAIEASELTFHARLGNLLPREGCIAGVGAAAASTAIPGASEARKPSRTDRRMRADVVVGAGLAGLTAARKFVRRPLALRAGDDRCRRRSTRCSRVQRWDCSVAARAARCQAVSHESEYLTRGVEPASILIVMRRGAIAVGALTELDVERHPAPHALPIQGREPSVLRRYFGNGSRRAHRTHQPSLSASTNGIGLPA